MVANNITGLPVVDETRELVGIVTEKDVLSLLYNIQDHPGSVADFMSRNVVAFDQDDDLRDLDESFKANHFRRVPIMDKGKLVGIVSRKDVIRYMRRLQAASPVRAANSN